MNLRKLKYLRGRVYSKLRKIGVNKRQRLVLGVLVLGLSLFLSEYLLGKSGVFAVFTLALLADVVLFIALFNDIEENFNFQLFILPFLYSLAFGLFYLLVPARFLTRIIMSSLYSVGLYSLFLSQNIFAVSSIRTIALLSSARTVSFTISILSYFFLSNVIFSLHTNIFLTIIFLFLFTFPMSIQALWIYTLDKNPLANLSTALALSIAICEIAVVLWFWPSSPTVVSLFLSGVFYSLIGVSHAWIEKRLFRSVILEYVWVSIVIFIVLIFYSFVLS